MAYPTNEQMQEALRFPQAREVVTHLLYEEERLVGRIDPDLAVMRSFSLNAKIAFQRQRNVERRLAGMGHEYPYQRINRAIFKVLGIGDWMQP